MNDEIANQAGHGDATSSRLLPRPRDAQHVTALRYFHEVARFGSIRLASERLNVASSAISRQIAKLESEVGEPLFERQPHGMTLTAAGRIYHDYVRDTFLGLRRVHSEIGRLRGLKSGHVRLATIEGLVASFLSLAISDFRKSHPGVSFDVVITSADEVVGRLGAGASDIGLAFNAPARDGIAYRQRIPDPVAAVMAPDFPLASRRRLRLADVLSVPTAVPVRSFGIRNLLDQACRDERLPLSPALETNSIEALRAFARNGDGVAFLHQFAIERELHEGLVVSRDIEAPALKTGTIDVCVLSEKLLPVAAQEFAGFLQQRMPAIRPAGRTAGQAFLSPMS